MSLFKTSVLGLALFSAHIFAVNGTVPTSCLWCVSVGQLWDSTSKLCGYRAGISSPQECIDGG
jgi:hypothetical protein